MKKILVSGSLAYDHLYTFPGVFQDELISDTKGALSVAFNVTDKAINFGGCAGNIVFNAKLLNEDFILVSIAGHDFALYQKWLKRHKIDTGKVIIEKSDYTAQAIVVSDLKNQQITFFHEGAASQAKKHKTQIKRIFSDLSRDVLFAVIAPNDKDFITTSIEACAQHNIPFFFDPGQAIPLFKPAELKNILQHSKGLIVNEYELALFKNLSRLTQGEILQLCKLLIVTLGEKGVHIYWKNKCIPIPAKKPKCIKDPTGCGDALRAGFFAGIKNYFPKLTPKVLQKAGELGVSLALSCLQSVGTQNHNF